jgi:hypothetical protein
VKDSAVVFWSRPITERDAFSKDCFVLFYCDKEWALGRYGFDLSDKLKSLWAVFHEAIKKREGTISLHTSMDARLKAR